MHMPGVSWQRIHPQLLPGTHQKILETIVNVMQCEQCDSAGELLP